MEVEEIERTEGDFQNWTGAGENPLHHRLSNIEYRPRPDLRKNLDSLFDKALKGAPLLPLPNTGNFQNTLEDSVIIKAFKKAIEDNPQLFKGKKVLDLNCGLCHLSKFCIDAGATHVVAVDSSLIIPYTQQIIKLNNLDQQITVLQGKLKEVELPIKSFDIVVCEWMGFNLFFDSALEDIIYARDHLLSEGGLIMPDRAVMHIAGIDDSSYIEERTTFWDSVYGYNYKSLKKWQLLEPVIDVCPVNLIVTQESSFFDIDLQTFKMTDLEDREAVFKLQSLGEVYLNAFVMWFDASFSFGKKRLTISTSPYYQQTKYKQTIYQTRADIPLNLDNCVDGKIKFKINKDNNKDLEITMEFSSNNEKSGPTKVSSFFILS